MFTLAIAPPAFAGDRYAAPTSQGTGDCLTAANACDFEAALTGAGNGDRVLVRADLGAYSLGDALVSNTSGRTVHVQGINGRPQLNFASGGLLLTDGSSLDNAAIAGGSAIRSLFTLEGGGNANRVIVEDSGSFLACDVMDSTLTDSICWSAVPVTSGNGALRVSGHDTLRNDTIYVAAAGSAPGIYVRGLGDVGEPGVADLVNVVARGGEDGGPGVELESDGTEDSTANLSYSNASAVASPGEPGHEHVNTNPTDEAPNPNLPLFVDPFHGNFRELPQAPTIDHGLDSPANEALDVYGTPRTLDGRTDIGAAEFIPDTFAGVTIVTRTATVSKGHLSIAVSCPTNAAGPVAGGAGSCQGKLTLRTARKVKLPNGKKKRLTLGSARFALAAGSTGMVGIDLTKRGRHLLKKRGRLRSAAIAQAHDARGQTKMSKAHIKLKLASG